MKGGAFTPRWFSGKPMMGGVDALGAFPPARWWLPPVIANGLEISLMMLCARSTWKLAAFKKERR